jgi:hypothetical protein
MSDATSKVTNPSNHVRSRAMAENENSQLVDYNLDPQMIRQPDYFVYIFSVSERDFDVSRPGLNISKVTLKGCPEAKFDKAAYSLCMKVPHPYPLPYVDQTNGQIRLETAYGERAAMDILNPNQKTLTMDAYIDPKVNIGVGDDLIARGLFLVKDEQCTFRTEEQALPDGKKHKVKLPVPPAAAVAKAVERKEKYYNDLIDKATALEHSNPAELRDSITQNPDYHLAAEYFDLETSWHKKHLKKAAPVVCRNCGLEKTRGAAFHFLPNGRPCVEDWDAAIESGAVTEAERPAKKGGKA